MPTKATKKPVLSTYIGNVGCSVFANENKAKDGKMFTTYTISIQRSFNDLNGKRKYTSSLGVADIGNATILLQKAANDIIAYNNGNR